MSATPAAATNSSNLVICTVDHGIARLELNRPDARNALSLDLIRALGATVRELAPRCTPGADGGTAPEVRVLVLSGRGRAFCAGMDLKAVASDPAAMGEMLRELSRVNRSIRRLPVPTIAQVQGAAVGGGCGLMVVCDFAFTHAEAKVGYPEVDLGVCPAVVAPWLIRKIGAGPARAMLLAGGTMSGEAGFRAGLATHLVPEEELPTAVQAFAMTLVKGGAHALAATKRLLNELDGSMDDRVADEAAAISARVIAGAEAQSRLRALFARQ
ncbi:MAG: enoyl-CoA hydratase/isomerase family protein [Phycisphaeraceae bacterium]|nr:enoyl-CoA hydratase/isomerase family protein [Phycisphaeraceae bacterium]